MVEVKDCSAKFVVELPLAGVPEEEVERIVLNLEEGVDCMV